MVLDTDAFLKYIDKCFYFGLFINCDSGHSQYSDEKQILFFFAVLLGTDTKGET